MADWPDARLKNKTLMQYAHTPYMDSLARMGRTGMLKTIPEGFHPGSEVANSSILGYDQTLVYEGRGPLEAASIGVELEPGDLALRCNFICIERENIKNHSCGNLSTEESDILIRMLNENNDDSRLHFYTGVSYRNLLVIKGGDKNLDCTPPHDIPGQPWKSNLVKPLAPEAASTAMLLNELIIKSQALLASHPINRKRLKEGKDPASSIWPWAGGYKPKMSKLSERFPEIRKGSVISAVDLIRGIGRYAGLNPISVEGATGLADTNYEGKAAAALNALKQEDFVYLHIEASDEAGHEGNLELKLKTIENLDKKIVGTVVEEISKWDEDVAIAVLPDHPTPVKLRTHTAEPVPFLFYHKGIIADKVASFDEESCRAGYYGSLEKDLFIKAFLAL